MNQNFFAPAEVTALYANTGADKTRKPTGVLLALGLLAGMLIALGGAATNTAIYGITDPWTARTICGLLFPFGLGMVVATGAELFTGNCLISISVLDKRCAWKGMLRNWVLVYLSNFAGALLVAAGCALFGQMNYSGGQLALFTMQMAATKCAAPFQNGVVMGFFCNLLVSLGVIMALAGKDMAGRLLGAFMPVAFFVFCGFEHCVANMYYISAGLIAKTVPAYAQLAAETGLDLSVLTVGNFLLGNLLPVTLGNILGGAGLGTLLWYCYRPQKEG